MDRTYIESLMNKYGIEEEDAEIITELKKRIRKISPLSKEQKEGCQVCNKSSKEETIYNHHMMKVEYLAILAYYYDLYECENILLLGRVMSGKGGDLIIKEANRVLADEYPEIADRMKLSLPDEKFRRVGQSVAAASLPEIKAR